MLGLQCGTGTNTWLIQGLGQARQALYQLSYAHSDNFLRDQKGNQEHISPRGVLRDDSVAPKDAGSTIVMSRKGQLLGSDTPVDRRRGLQKPGQRSIQTGPLQWPEAVARLSTFQDEQAHGHSAYAQDPHGALEQVMRTWAGWRVTPSGGSEAPTASQR